MPRVRFTVRLMIVVIALSAALAHFVAVPTWRYYQLPPETRRVLGKLGITMPLLATGPTPPDLNGFLKQIRAASVIGPKDIGIPIYLDPIGLQESGATMTAPVDASGGWMAIKDHLDRTLPPLGLDYFVKDGMLTITSAKIARVTLRDRAGNARHP